MVQNVIQTGRQPNRGDIVPAVREPHHPCAKPQQNDPDILDAVVREESFEIVLHQRVEHPSTADNPPTVRTITPQDNRGTPRPNAQTRTMP